MASSFDLLLGQTPEDVYDDPEATLEVIPPSALLPVAELDNASIVAVVTHIEKKEEDEETASQIMNRMLDDADAPTRCPSPVAEEEEEEAPAFVVPEMLGTTAAAAAAAAVIVTDSQVKVTRASLMIDSGLPPSPTPSRSETPPMSPTQHSAAPELETEVEPMSLELHLSMCEPSQADEVATSQVPVATAAAKVVPAVVSQPNAATATCAPSRKRKIMAYFKPTREEDADDDDVVVLSQKPAAAAASSAAAVVSRQVSIPPAEIRLETTLLPLDDVDLAELGLFCAIPRAESADDQDPNTMLRKFLHSDHLSPGNDETLLDAFAPRLAAGELVTAVHATIRTLHTLLVSDRLSSSSLQQRVKLYITVRWLRSRGMAAFCTTPAHKLQFFHDLRECICAFMVHQKKPSRYIQSALRNLLKLENLPTLAKSAPTMPGDLPSADTIPHLLLAERLAERGSVTFHRARNFPYALPFASHSQSAINDAKRQKV